MKLVLVHETHVQWTPFLLVVQLFICENTLRVALCLYS